MHGVVTFTFGAIDSLTDHISMISCKNVQAVVKILHDKHKASNIDPYVLFVTLWSDDFEVNHTRKNRNSTWIKTVTFASTNDMST